MIFGSENLDKALLELKLSKLVGHQRKGYKVQAAEILGMTPETVSRNLVKPSTRFLKRLDRAMLEVGKAATGGRLSDEERMQERDQIEARIMALGAYRARLDEESRRIFDMGADYARSRAAIEH